MSDFVVVEAFSSVVSSYGALEKCTAKKPYSINICELDSLTFIFAILENRSANKIGVNSAVRVTWCRAAHLVQVFVVGRR